MGIRTFGKEDGKLILKDFGEISFYFSFAFLVPIIVSLIYNEGMAGVTPYLASFIICISIGYFFKKAFYTKGVHSREIHAFGAIVLVWIIIPLIGALPYIMYQDAGVMDSYFESTSAITTTGLSVIGKGIELPHSLIFWRSLESWIGGVGIIILVLVGILRYTKRTRLYEAEGREDRLRPSVVNTVKKIWWIYFSLTGIGILMLLATDVNAFDAVNYSMSAISTTGIAHTSTGFIDINANAQIALAVIMILGAMSFLIHYRFARGEWLAYGRDVQMRIMLVLLIFAFLMLLPRFSAAFGENAAHQDFFHTVSAFTDGGFQTESAADWDPFMKISLAVLMTIGGASGSTAGGIKLIRLWIFLKSISWRIRSFTLPKNAVFAKKVAGKEVKDEDISMVNIFILLYLLFLGIGTMFIMFVGDYEADDAFFEVSSAQGNAGITTGISEPGVTAPVQGMLIINMIVGRLEIIPILAAIGFVLNIKRR